MKEEWFDVVDKKDQVIGRELRSVVHARGLRHRAVHVMVVNSAGLLFLQKRSMLKDCFPGTWDSSASGHLDTGEDYDMCAIREMREELGWDHKGPMEKLFKIDACPETGMEFVWIYRAQAEGPFILQPEEIETGGWFGADHITSWLREKPEEFAGAVPIIWSKLQAYLSK